MPAEFFNNTEKLDSLTDDLQVTSVGNTWNKQTKQTPQ